MEESVDPHEEAGKENEPTLANLSPTKEATSKDEVKIEKFLQEQKSKNTLLFDHIINILLTELGWSVWENLDQDTSLTLKRGPQGSSDLETAAKFTCTGIVEKGQESDDHGADMQESGYGSSLEISVDKTMFSGYPSEVDDIPVEGNHKLCRFAENILRCEITLSQKAAGQRKKEKKKRKKEESNKALVENKSPQDKIVEKACTLLNSGGGVLKMAISDHQEIPINDFAQHLDKFWQTLEEKLSDLVKPSTYNDVFDRHLVGSEDILLFINAPQRLCTIHYNLYFAGDAGAHESTFEQAVELLQKLDNCRKKPSNYVDICLKELPKLPKVFIFEENCEYQESQQIQLKHFSGTEQILRSHGQRERVQKHISAFANTNGGIILVGVNDSGIVLGVDMKKNNQDEIIKRVISMIENMKFPITQERKVHWDIDFIPVSGCEITQDLAVVAIKVAGMKSLGGIFMKHPESYELDHDTVRVVEFDQWKQRMLSGSKLQTDTKATEHLCSMFEKLEISSEVTPVLSIKSQVEEIRDSFFAMQEGFQVTPKGFHENLPKDVQDTIREIKKLSSLHTKSCGLIVASKSLLVNLGGSPSDDVVCDLLVISTGLGGLHLYTVCKEGKEEECLHYSKEVSLLLKTSLVRGGGCPVRFYVSYHITSSSKEVKSPLPDKQYPPSYDLKGRTEDLNLVLKALVIILAKVPSPLSSKLGVTFLCLLTREQFGLVHQQIYVNRELWVKGVAGSGKTLVALEVIKKIRLKEHLENHEILYVAENEGIVEQIREYHVCKAVCRQTFLRSSFPEVRHVILDEAHNYQQPKGGTSWLRKARKIVRQHDGDFPGYLWIFTDEHQLNHNFNTGMPPKCRQRPEFRLKTVIRNSGEVFQHATRHLTRQGGSVQDHPTLGHNFMGEKVYVKPYSSSSTSQLQVLNKTLEELIKEGYKSRDIAVLFSKGDCIPDRPFAGPAYCSAAGNGSDKLVVSTVRKYSGLERPVVVLVDLECSIPEGCNMRAFQYCAQTRAMVKLVIIRCEVCEEICRSQRQ